MSTITLDAQVTMQFSDTETRNYTLPNVSGEDIVNVKTRVKQLNQVFDGDSSGISAAVVTYADNMKLTFVSSGGAPLTRISKASYTITEEEVVYDVNT